jgi:gamma-glutamylcyclotransferase (GGCT)/AIG2-like uncharacterized protein YtfP
VRFREPKIPPLKSLPVEPQYLFVYGTLLPGQAPASIAPVANQLKIIGPAATPGRLYHLGPYPGCVLDPHCQSQIQGQLLELPHPAEPVLAKLDWYEAYVASDPRGSLFTRTTCPVTLQDGRQQTAWIYVYNRDVTDARRIASGKYDPRGKTERHPK